jgi:hypothetical protein
VSDRETPEPRRLTDDDVLAAGRIIERLADLYVLDAATVARVCDETLDRSGALLGHVRTRVRDTGRKGGYPQ